MQMSVNGLWLVDSVCDSESVQAIEDALAKTAKGLLFMQDKVPAKWLTVRIILQSLEEQCVDEKK